MGRTRVANCGDRADRLDDSKITLCIVSDARAIVINLKAVKLDKHGNLSEAATRWGVSMVLLSCSGQHKIAASVTGSARCHLICA
jgi:hypothetical protein